jgi:hypothetical protein
MGKFLRLFPAYRVLEALLAESEAAHAREVAGLQSTLSDLAAEKTRLEDLLEAAQADRQKLWDSMQSALEGERTAYQSQINVAWQQRGAAAPYPDAPHLEKSALAPKNDTIPRRLRPSEAVARQTAKFIAGVTAKPKVA